MKYRTLALLALAACTALSAYAHTPLAKSSPADGGSVAAPLDALVLEFGADVRLTALSLVDSAGAKKTLDAVPTAIAAKFTVAVREPLAPGDYVATWRAVGGDTHIISGAIRFTVAAAHSH